MRTFEEMIKEFGVYRGDPVAAQAWYGTLSDEERQAFQKGVADMLAVVTEGFEKMRGAIAEAASGMAETLSEAIAPVVKVMEENPDLVEQIREYAQQVRDAGF